MILSHRQRSWVFSITALFFCWVILVSSSTAPAFCTSCCNSLGDFGLSSQGRECCDTGCEGTSSDEDCLNELNLEALAAGLAILNDINSIFVIGGQAFQCIDDEGVFQVIQTTFAPTSSPVADGIGPEIFIIVAVLVSVILVFASFIIFLRNRRKYLNALEDRLPRKRGIFGLNGNIDAKIPSKTSHIPKYQSSFFSSRETIGETLQTDILFYKNPRISAFNGVNVKVFKRDVKKEARSFHEFKRLSSVHVSQPRSVYFQDASLIDIDDLITNVCRKITRQLKRKNLDDGFSGIAEPDISLEKFLHRLVEYLDKWYSGIDGRRVPRPTGVNSLIISLIYQKRMKERVPDFFLTLFNIHRIFAVTTLLAAKFSEDEIITNSYWSEVCLISVEELNKIEELFCASLEFNLYVTPREFQVVSTQYLPSNLSTKERRGLYSTIV